MDKITIELDKQKAYMFSLIVSSWRNEYEQASDHLSMMLQDLKEGLEPEEKWDEATIVKYLKSNDEAIELCSGVIDQIGAPIVM